MRFGKALCAAALAAAASGSANASGFATYFAEVNLHGRVVQSSAVHVATRSGRGNYTVEFNRAVTGCASTATVTGRAPGYAVISSAAGSTIDIVTYAKTGVATDLPFNLIVTCAP
jgi:hypothetical protein